jgi:hypothetical protein
VNKFGNSWLNLCDVFFLMILLMRITILPKQTFSRSAYLLLQTGAKLFGAKPLNYSQPLHVVHIHTTIQKFNSALGCICSIPKKAYFEMSKIEVFHLHIHNLRVFVKFRGKPIFSVVYVKKLKKNLVKSLTFSIIFFLHTPRRFIVKRLCWHVSREDVRANFLKCVKYVFQNKDSVCSQ